MTPVFQSINMGMSRTATMRAPRIHGMNTWQTKSPARNRKHDRSSRNRVAGAATQDIRTTILSDVLRMTASTVGGTREVQQNTASSWTDVATCAAFSENVKDVDIEIVPQEIF